MASVLAAIQLLAMAGLIVLTAGLGWRVGTKYWSHR
jgi:hypothetical protein